MSEQSLGVAAANSEMPEGNSASQEGGKIKEKEGKNPKPSSINRLLKPVAENKQCKTGWLYFALLPSLIAFRRDWKGPL